MQRSSAWSESDAGAWAIERENEPDDDESEERDNDDQKCSRAQYLQNGCLVRVPDAKADAKHCRDCLQSQMKVS